MRFKPYNSAVLFVLAAAAILHSQSFKREVKALVEPNFPQQIITAGGEGADVSGFTSEAIQRAIDALPAERGGTVVLSPGQYEIFSPIRLGSNTVLRGSGESTVLKKCAGFRSRFIIDADYGELLLTVEDPAGFRPGMAVQVYDDRYNSDWAVSTAVITEVQGDVLYIGSYLERDYHADANGMVSNACSIVSAVGVHGVTIRDLTVDGFKSSNDEINGCRGGAVYIHKSRRVLIENVRVRNFAGDGISWQITEDVTVRGCEISGCTGHGLHPGTGSPNTLIEDNHSHRNGREGLFVCWRVQNGMVRNNTFDHNERHGICTGHKDTDMIFEGNRIFENGSDGINLRRERPANAPHRNLFNKNLIENNGTREGGYGFAVYSQADEVVLRGNTFRNTGAGNQTAAVFISREGTPVELQDNVFEGHSSGPVILEKE